MDSAIKANTAKIDKETTDRKSEITRVEGKIPKSAGGRNLALGTSADWSAGWTNFNGGTNQTNVIYRIYNRGFKIGDKVHVRIVLKYSDIVAVGGKTASVITQCAGNVTQWNSGLLDGGTSSNFNGSNGEIEFKGTTVVDEHIVKNEYWNWQLRVDYVASGKIQWKEAKAEVGDLPTPWLPAPEDYDSKLASVKSEIKQTTDAISAKVTTAQSTADSAVTKANAAQTTANNNANTIGTHTTQINTLNSSLAQKQDKLTAGNGITIQGNVISSTGDAASQDAAIKANTAKINQEITDRKNEITRVEGKIPTSIGTVNLFKGSRDFSGTNWINGSNGVYAEDYQGVKIYKTQSIWNGRSQRFEVKAGEEYVFSAYVKSSAKTDGVTFFLTHNSYLPKAQGSASIGSNSNADNIGVSLTDKYQRVVIRIKITGDGWIAPRIERANSDAYLFFGGYKFEHGNVATDWSPAPEDIDSGLSYDNLSTDYGISKTKSGNTAKLGLECTDVGDRFDLNTLLNGRVRSGNFVNAPKANTWYFVTAFTEHAYTIQEAVTLVDNKNTTYRRTKQNGVWGAWREQVGDKSVIDDINSKITSVEGKIPKSGSDRNLVQGTSSDWSPFATITSNRNWIYDLCTVKYGYSTGIAAGTTINIFVHLSADEIVLDNSVSPRIGIQGTVIDKNNNETWTNWDKYHPFYDKWSTNLVAGTNYRIVKLSAKVSNESINNLNGFKIGIRIDGVKSGKFHYRALMITTGDVFPDSWSPAPEDYDTKLATVKSELTTKVTSAQSTADGAVTKANTAQNTANAAQTTANNNAKTIGTHTTQINQEITDRKNSDAQLQNRLAELERNAFKTYNIDTTNYSGYYSICSGAVIQYKVMAKTGKYIDLSNFTFSTGTDPLASAKLYSQSLSVDFEVTDTIGQTYVTNRTARFTLNDQRKIVIDPKSTVTGLINNLSKVKAFTLL